MEHYGSVLQEPEESSIGCVDVGIVSCTKVIGWEIWEHGDIMKTKRNLNV